MDINMIFLLIIILYDASDTVDFINIFNEKQNIK